MKMSSSFSSFHTRTVTRVAAVGLVLAALTSPSSTTAQQPTAQSPPADTDTASTGADRLSVEELYIDFVHFVMLGRYDIATAYGKELLQRPQADPDALLIIADRQPNSREALIWVTGRAGVGDLAAKVLQRIARGERNQRKDAGRILDAIEGLAGGARAELNNARRLRDSGEYAVPWMIQVLQDPKRATLHARVARTLPRIGKPAVNPILAALEMEDSVVLQTLIRALGEIGYPQAVPSLKVLAEDVDRPDDVRRAAADAIARILPSDRAVFSMSAAEALLAVAEDYWDNATGVRADPRDPQTNVWYWRDRILQPTLVPTTIYEEILCMRYCEFALRLRPDFEPAVALWLAANFRREAELGMDVESESPDDARAALDRTRPAEFLRSLYYARSAGPRFCHRVLGRALKSGNAAVALGAIAALDATGNAAGLVGPQDAKQPLVQALVFPDLAVRIKAALALAKALPQNAFQGSENVVPVLADALAQTGRRHALIIDPNQENRNRLAGLLADQGVLSLSEPAVLQALARAHKELPAIDVIFLASDVAKPTLAESLALFRRDFRLANTPLVFLAKPHQLNMCRNLGLGQPHVGVVPADAPEPDLTRTWADAAARVGRVPLNPDQALDLALQACESLRWIALTRSEAFSFTQAEPALIAALNHPAEELRIRAASVLALAPSRQAQDALAALALDPAADMSLRLPVFGSLAESAKHNGNLLNNDNLMALKALTMHASDPVLRTNASRALGALNLPPNDAATTIILGAKDAS